jgi:hypothetical protein
MLQTVSELESVRRAKLEVAARYEALRDQRVFLRNTIESLTKQQVNLDALRKMHELCGDVPPSILTRSVNGLGFTIPEFAELRSVLIAVISGALTRATDREAEREAALTKAQTTLAAVDVELSELERTNG